MLFLIEEDNEGRATVANIESSAEAMQEKIRHHVAGGTAIETLSVIIGERAPVRMEIAFGETPSVGAYGPPAPIPAPAKPARERKPRAHAPGPDGKSRPSHGEVLDAIRAGHVSTRAIVMYLDSTERAVDAVLGEMQAQDKVAHNGKRGKASAWAVVEQAAV